MKNAKLRIIVEGTTEEAFARLVLGPYFSAKGVSLKTYNLEGWNSYEKAKRYLLRLIKEDVEAWHTTMLDLYAIPNDFPKKRKHTV